MATFRAPDQGPRQSFDIASEEVFDLFRDKVARSAGPAGTTRVARQEAPTTITMAVTRFSGRFSYLRERRRIKVAANVSKRPSSALFFSEA